MRTLMKYITIIAAVIIVSIFSLSVYSGTFISNSGDYIFKTPGCWPEVLKAPDDVYTAAEYLNQALLVIQFRHTEESEEVDLIPGMCVYVASEPYYPLGASLRRYNHVKKKTVGCRFWVYKDYKVPTEVSREAYIRWMKTNDEP